MYAKAERHRSRADWDNVLGVTISVKKVTKAASHLSAGTENTGKQKKAISDNWPISTHTREQSHRSKADRIKLTGARRVIIQTRKCRPRVWAQKLIAVLRNFARHQRVPCTNKNERENGSRSLEKYTLQGGSLSVRDFTVKFVTAGSNYSFVEIKGAKRGAF